MIKVAVVILNWNGRSYLEKFLPSVIKYSNQDNCEVIIADNDSSDDSVEFLKKQYPQLRIIQLDKNYGYAQGYNLALEQVESEFYVLLNSDIEVSENWIQPVIDLMELDDKIGAAMPKILSYNSKTFFEYAGAAGGFIDKFGYPFCRGRILDSLEEDNGQYDQNSEVFWATGACLFVKSKAFKEAGGFDGDFFAHMEEIDLCWRLKNLGYRNMYCSESKIYHVGGGTLDATSPFKLYLNFRNNLFLLYKNLHPKKFLGILMSRMILDGVSALTYLVQLQPKNFSAVFKAHIHFYKALKSLKNKRAQNIKSGMLSEHSCMYNSSIVLKNKLKAIKKFSQLNFK